MRKDIIREPRERDVGEGNWLDLGKSARVEVSSEDPAHPVESALTPNAGGGWRAAEPGVQTVRLIFDAPQRIERIQLQFIEEERARTQEFVLRWSADAGKSYREIVRQQFNFNPPGTTGELEDYTVALAGVAVLELVITPEIGGSDAKASLARWRLA